MRQAGSIVKKRNRYYVVYRDPEKKQKWVGGFEKKADAQNERTRILGDIQGGSYFNPGKVTFEEFAERWLNNRLSIGAKTWESYQTHLKRHIIPIIGKAQMTSLDHLRVQSVISQLCQKKVHSASKTQAPAARRTLSAKSIKNIASLLGTLFKAAVNERVIRINPALGLELPKRIKKEMQLPQKEDVLQILEQAPPDVRLMFQVEVLTGLRRGEVLALQWHDIDWTSGELLVRRAIKKVRGTDGAHKWGYAPGPTKSNRSRRLGLSLLLLTNLKALRAMTLDQPEGSFIFQRNGTFIDPEYFTKWIALPLVKRASGGRVKRFHDLRHFYASMKIEQKDNVKEIQEAMGHASITTTLDIYGHLMPNSRQESADRLEKSLFSPSVRTLLEQKADSEAETSVN